MTVSEALAWAQKRLATQDDAAVAARVLLASATEQSQTWLYTWPDKHLSDEQWATFQRVVERRSKGEPVAYILGYREFWSLTLRTSPSTLIPRPDTEVLVEAALSRLSSGSQRVCDLGTGTGAIALAIASERPDCDVLGCDLLEEAVTLATCNASDNGITNASFVQSSWFDNLHGRFEMIVTNPPYVEQQSRWLQKGDVRFEPHSALTSGVDGLDDIRIIVAQAPGFLSAGGWLLIEHGYTQGEAVRALLQRHGFAQTQTIVDLAGHDRVSVGRLQTCE
ncbi:peptide chain release factor N(5)-glutamine methyltransferase [Alteromonas sp. H39]|uniref:peptide chain release factor N(5)-glutamine methyltransferase n=1 Tax=Alteromonas sp. H39 TaxID=3389876 RepID=UPI0039E07702